MDPLHRQLRRLARRLAVQRWAGYVSTGVFFGACGATVWVVVARLFPGLGDPLPISAASVGAGVLLGTVFAVLRRPSVLDAALEADRRLGLRERLTSSFELAGVEGEMVQALHADARRHLARLNTRAQFPFVSTRAMRWTFAPLLAFALTCTLLPEFDLFKQRSRIAEAKARDEAVAVHVERIQEAAMKLHEENVEGGLVDGAMAEIDALADDLRTGEITDKQALARLTNLSDELSEHREALAEKSALPKMVDDPENLGLARDMAKALQDGNMQKAAQAAADLKKKLEAGELTKDEARKLSEDLKKMAEKLGGANTELGQQLAQAMAKASASLASGEGKEGAGEAMEALVMSLEDLESLAEQLSQLDTVMASVQEWQQGLWGPSDYCRLCGAKLGDCEGGECDAQGGHKHNGVCGTCAGSGNGPGMGGAGRGAGNEVGELGDPQVAFQPTKAPGPMTRGKMLADILQKSAPEEGEQATVEYISGAFASAQQAAEQALTQQEIPRGSEEYVRQYFGSLEPEKEE